MRRRDLKLREEYVTRCGARVQLVDFGYDFIRGVSQTTVVVEVLGPYGNLGKGTKSIGITRLYRPWAEHIAGLRNLALHYGGRP